jgi:hypothetical protein
MPINQIINGSDDGNQTISEEQSGISNANASISSNLKATNRSGIKSGTSVISQVSSFYSIQNNDSKKNLFKRIVMCKYGPRFEYLLNVFETTLNIKESVQARRFKFVSIRIVKST